MYSEFLILRDPHNKMQLIIAVGDCILSQRKSDKGFGNLLTMIVGHYTQYIEVSDIFCRNL